MTLYFEVFGSFKQFWRQLDRWICTKIETIWYTKNTFGIMIRTNLRSSTFFTEFLRKKSLKSLPNYLSCRQNRFRWTSGHLINTLVYFDCIKTANFYICINLWEMATICQKNSVNKTWERLVQFQWILYPHFSKWYQLSNESFGRWMRQCHFAWINGVWKIKDGMAWEKRALWRPCSKSHGHSTVVYLSIYCSFIDSITYSISSRI